VELIGAAEAVKHIAATPHALDFNQGFDAKVTFTDVNTQHDAKPHPEEQARATVEAVGVKACIISLDSPVLNPISGLAVHFGSVFLQSFSWFESLMGEELQCTGHGTMTMKAPALEPVMGSGTCTAAPHLSV
jgi:hypothetical protein